MNRPTHYLWRNDFPSQEEFETAKDEYKKQGFRVITYQENPGAENILDGLKAVIMNHSGNDAGGE